MKCNLMISFEDEIIEEDELIQAINNMIEENNFKSVTINMVR